MRDLVVRTLAIAGPCAGELGDRVPETPALDADWQDIVGNSPALRDVLRRVEIVAPTDSAVLILGETGTGKELIARAIHAGNARRGGHFAKLNCAAMAPTLVESELFGHERGAFTGAVARRQGRFELAREGTIFLDEVGELPLEVQPKLLRVLQEREFERLGGTQSLRSNARLVAATNRDLRGMVAKQTFRADLYYRLNVFPVHVPSLRERRDDIPLLAEFFATQFARRMKKSTRGISPAAMAVLRNHDWPGNIRELQNVIERAVILSTGPRLDVVIDPEIRDTRETPRQRDDGLDEVMRTHIVSVLRSTNGVVGGPGGAAARLGMKRSTLLFRMRKLGITPRALVDTPPVLPQANDA